jgi:anti-sigma regulatory factor (Ser/Thr protein kinase)
VQTYEGFIPEIRTVIGHIARDFGFNDQEAYEIVLVIDEVCNNALEHGSKGKYKNVSLECKFDKQEVEITVKDSGSHQFNVEEALKHNQELMEERTAKPMLERGLGLVIVQKCVDSLKIVSSSLGTEVKMVKKSHKDSGNGYQISSVLSV